MTFARIEEQGLEAWLAGLRAELVSKTYRPEGDLVITDVVMPDENASN
jgi:hypothetical protein